MVIYGLLCKVKIKWHMSYCDILCHHCSIKLMLIFHEVESFESDHLSTWKESSSEPINSLPLQSIHFSPCIMHLQKLPTFISYHSYHFVFFMKIFLMGIWYILHIFIFCAEVGDISSSVVPPRSGPIIDLLIKCWCAGVWSLWHLFINSLAPGKFEWNFRYVIFKEILVIDGWGISCEIAVIWISLVFTDDQSTLVQVMAWCHQATSHYLSQCWPRSLSPYGVTRPQWVNGSRFFSNILLSMWNDESGHSLGIYGDINFNRNFYDSPFGK